MSSPSLMQFNKWRNKGVQNKGTKFICRWWRHDRGSTGREEAVWGAIIYWSGPRVENQPSPQLLLFACFGNQQPSCLIEEFWKFENHSIWEQDLYDMLENMQTHGIYRQGSKSSKTVMWEQFAQDSYEELSHHVTSATVSNIICHIFENLFGCS